MSGSLALVAQSVSVVLDAAVVPHCVIGGLAALDFEREVVERATPFTFDGGTVVRTCSAEDLVVLKAFADRPRDWSDIEGIAARQGKALDWNAIIERISPLAELKGEPRIVERLRAIRDARRA